MHFARVWWQPRSASSRAQPWSTPIPCQREHGRWVGTDGHPLTERVRRWLTAKDYHLREVTETEVWFAASETDGIRRRIWVQIEHLPRSSEWQSR